MITTVTVTQVTMRGLTITKARRFRSPPADVGHADPRGATAPPERASLVRPSTRFPRQVDIEPARLRSTGKSGAQTRPTTHRWALRQAKSVSQLDLG